MAKASYSDIIKAIPSNVYVAFHKEKLPKVIDASKVHETWENNSFQAVSFTF